MHKQTIEWIAIFSSKKLFLFNRTIDDICNREHIQLCVKTKVVHSATHHPR